MIEKFLDLKWYPSFPETFLQLYPSVQLNSCSTVSHQNCLTSKFVKEFLCHQFWWVGGGQAEYINLDTHWKNWCSRSFGLNSPGSSTMAAGFILCSIKCSKCKFFEDFLNNSILQAFTLSSRSPSYSWLLPSTKPRLPLSRWPIIFASVILHFDDHGGSSLI